MNKQRILSGIRPTGGIHLGNYLGYLKQAVELSQEPNTECFFMIADYHALMSFRETPLKQASYDILAWELAAGLDPEQSVLFVQSQVPAHTELAWIFNALVTVAELNRMTQYKDLVARGLEQPSAALLTYPVLQAADVLLYKATAVPVGKDQVQHLELTRTLARRFNTTTNSAVFPEPQPKLTHSANILDLHDPTKKMAKSTPSGALLLEDDEATLRNKISRAVTDTGPVDIPEELVGDALLMEGQIDLLLQSMSPGVRNLFGILGETTTNKSHYQTLLENYKNKSLQYRDLKAAVADSVVAFILPLQQKFQEYRVDEAKLDAILTDGSAKANQVANITLREAKNEFKLL